MELGSLFSKKYPPHLKWGGYFLQRAKIFILMTLPLRPHLFFTPSPRGKVKREKMKVSLKNAKEGKKRPRPGPGRAKIS